MSSIVCQGLQSCLEPLVLRHKLTPPPKPNDSEAIQRNQENRFDGGRSFIQNLSDASQMCKETNEIEKVYVHPLVKHSSSALSEKSLEMCTECLGSETGSESGDEFSSSLLWEGGESYGSSRLSRTSESGEKLSRCRDWNRNRNRNYPPPLKSISSSDGVHVRPHREAGRLVIEAVSVSSCRTFLQAERADGRLRLCLMSNSSANFDTDGQEDGRVEEDQENGGKSDYEIGNILEIPSRCKESGNANKWIPVRGPYCVPIS